MQGIDAIAQQRAGVVIDDDVGNRVAHVFLLIGSKRLSSTRQISPIEASRIF